LATFSAFGTPQKEIIDAEIGKKDIYMGKTREKLMDNRTFNLSF